MSSETRMHFRRCHICGEVNCVEGHDVRVCTHCNKLMAPFFFFQQSSNEGYSDTVIDTIVESVQNNSNDKVHRKSKKETKFHYQPLRGLTVIW